MLSNTFVAHHWFKGFLVAMTILAIGLIPGILMLNAAPVETGTVDMVIENEANVPPGIEASAARYTALAEYYAARNDSVQRGLSADAARYSALAEHYALQRSQNASAARYTALATHYQNDGLQRGLNADAARLNALAEYYASLQVTQ